MVNAVMKDMGVISTDYKTLAIDRYKMRRQRLFLEAALSVDGQNAPPRLGRRELDLFSSSIQTHEETKHISVAFSSLFFIGH